MKNILILYPYRFRNYDYDRFELRFLKKKYNIIILDILDLIHPHFKEAYKKEKLKFKVIKPKNIKNLFFFLKKYKNLSNTIIFNFNTSINLKALIVNLFIKKLNIDTYGFYIPGNFFWDPKNLPILKRLLFYIKQNIYDPKRVIWNLRSRFYLFLNFIFNVKLDYLFVAGKKYIPKKNLFKKIFEINSWDYSRLKLYKKKIKKKKIYITFLDAPGPLFKSDSFLLKRNNDETAENTYPSLRNFFDNIEKKFGSQVVIAAHPKTKHGNYPKYFGERKVIHNKTLELIHKSNLVITRNSSAITYAIYYKIPIIFIYTKEIKKKKNVNFYNIYYLAKELNLEAININSYKEKLIKKKIFNLSKYQDFEKKYFSNINSNKPNHELIHQAIMSNK